MFFAHAVNGRFQPTLPARGATRLAACRVSGSTISTHAPRTGSDTNNCIVEISTTHFNPRSPHGERQTSMPAPSYMSAFQPTLPARGATCCRISHTSTRQPFQPTLPARGATRHAAADVCVAQFQPTLPARGATVRPAKPRAFCVFQPTLPARGATGRLVSRVRWDAFQPTLPARGATRCTPQTSTLWRFQPTLPARGATA